MNIYLGIVLAILIGHYFLELLVENLNLRSASSHLPEEFSGFYDAAKYKKAQDYLKINCRFKLGKEGLFTLLIIAFILAGGFNLADRFARGFNRGPIATGLIFAASLMLALKVLSIPFSAYHTFVIEERFGFNRTTPKTFILDILKGLILGAIIGGIVFSGVLWFFGKMGSYAWVYCWLGVPCFQLFLVFSAPVVILPIFNKFTS